MDDEYKTWRVQVQGVMVIEVPAYDENEARMTAVIDSEMDDCVVIDCTEIHEISVDE